MGFFNGIPKKLIKRVNEIEIDTHYYDNDVIPSNQELFTYDIDEENIVSTITGFAQENVTIAIVPYKIKYGDQTSNMYAQVTELEDSAFSNYTYIESITLPNTIHEIPISLFEGCTNLSDCNIPRSINKINSKAFKNCSSLDTLFIGTNVKEIASDAFDGCIELDIICYKGSYAETYAKAHNIPYSLISYTLDDVETKDSPNLLTSGVIYNIKTFLHNFITTNYVPKVGKTTISLPPDQNNDTVLTLKSGSQNESYIGLNTKNNAVFGYIGVTADDRYLSATRPKFAPETNGVTGYILVQNTNENKIGSVDASFKGTAHNKGSFVEGSSNNLASEVVTTEDINNAIANTPNSEQFISKWNDNKFSFAGGENSHVEGSNCLALGKNSHAEGNGTIAEQSSSHAEGTGSHASGKYSHAGGLESIASGQGSFAHGQRVKATGSGAIVIGYNDAGSDITNAQGDRSIVLGHNSEAIAFESIAIGSNLITDNNNQMVIGKYNLIDDQSQFVIGNGTSSSNRLNSFYIRHNKAYISGEISESDDDKVLITKEYLNGYLNKYFPIKDIFTYSNQVNNAFDAGLYMINFSYNLNGEYTYGEMLSIPYTSVETGKEYGAQLFFATGDYNDGRQNCFWYRTYDGEAWNSWIKVDPQGINNKISQLENKIDQKIQMISESDYEELEIKDENVLYLIPEE